MGLPDLWALSTARHPSADLMPTRHLGPPPPEVIAVPATATLPEVRAAATRALRYTYRMFRPRLLKPGAGAAGAGAGAGAAAAGEVLQHEQPPGFEVSRIVAGLPHQVWTRVWTLGPGMARKRKQMSIWQTSSVTAPYCLPAIMTSDVSAAAVPMSCGGPVSKATLSRHHRVLFSCRWMLHHLCPPHIIYVTLHSPAFKSYPATAL